MDPFVRLQDAPQTATRPHKCRPGLAGEEGDDEVQRNLDQKNDDEIEGGPETTLHEDDNESTDDLNDEDYANQSEASSSDVEATPFETAETGKGPSSMAYHDPEKLLPIPSISQLKICNQLIRSVLRS